MNARKTNGSSANNNELSLINNAIIINTIMAPKMLEHNIANFFAFFSFILLPIEIKILLETIILQLEYKIIEAVKYAKFVASKENVIAEWEEKLNDKKQTNKVETTINGTKIRLILTRHLKPFKTAKAQIISIIIDQRWNFVFNNISFNSDSAPAIIVDENTKNITL